MTGERRASEGGCARESRRSGIQRQSTMDVPRREEWGMGVGVKDCREQFSPKHWRQRRELCVLLSQNS